MSEVLAIIPARGGSKSIPKKNITPLAERPLIAHILDTLSRSRRVSRTIVSTDDDEIASVAGSLGADVPFLRPGQLARDTSPTVPVLHHAVEWLAENESYEPELIVLTQPTSPFTQARQIDGAIKMLLDDSSADAVTTVIEVEHNFHPYNIHQINPDGSVTFVLPEEHDRYPTRQEKPKRYAFGNCYVFRHATLTQKGSIYGDRCLPMVIDPLTAFDINDPHEILMAEAILNSGALPRDD